MRMGSSFESFSIPSVVRVKPSFFNSGAESAHPSERQKRFGFFGFLWGVDGIIAALP